MLSIRITNKKNHKLGNNWGTGGACAPGVQGKNVKNKKQFILQTSTFQF